MEFVMSHAVDFLIPFRSANWRIGISPRRQLEKISCSSGESISIADSTKSLASTFAKSDVGSTSQSDFSNSFSLKSTLGTEPLHIAGSNEALVQDDLITLQSQCARNAKFRDLVLSVGIGSDTADASIRRETGE